MIPFLMDLNSCAQRTEQIRCGLGPVTWRTLGRHGGFLPDPSKQACDTFPSVMRVQSGQQVIQHKGIRPRKEFVGVTGQRVDDGGLAPRFPSDSFLYYQSVPFKGGQMPPDGVRTDPDLVSDLLNGSVGSEQKLNDAMSRPSD